MYKNFKTSTQIENILKKQGAQRVHELAIQTGLSKQRIHRVLLVLLEEKKIKRIGKAPRVFYLLNKELNAVNEPGNIPVAKTSFLEKHFLFVRETGERQNGPEGMITWCMRQKLPLEKTIDEFIAARKKYLAYFNNQGLISGMEKLKTTKSFSSIGPDEMYYIDFYAIERFGKTRLGTLLHFAKQGQNKNLMNELVEEISPAIHQLIKREKTDAVAFIPPTIKREVQLMKFLEKKLALPLPHIKIAKVSGEIVVPQKALSRIEDRIINAKSTLFPMEAGNFQHILLIDDAIGSGASVNETALKLKEKNPKAKITALAVTGSYKGFEVISEV